jgi:arylsulfatase A-like enzyme
MADDAIEYMRRITAINPEQPFFIYYVPGAVHAPHHPTPEWIKKISDMHLFDEGWNKLRDTIFANQKKLGVIPQDAKLTPWPKDLLKEWDQLTPDEKKMFIRQVDVFAAYWAYSDHEIGRVIDEVERMGKLDNTLIIYIAGDNGNSAEGSLIGTPNEVASIQGINTPVEDQLQNGQFRCRKNGPCPVWSASRRRSRLRHAACSSSATNLASRRRRYGRIACRPCGRIASAPVLRPVATRRSSLRRDGSALNRSR